MGRKNHPKYETKSKKNVEETINPIDYVLRQRQTKFTLKTSRT